MRRATEARQNLTGNLGVPFSPGLMGEKEHLLLKVTTKQLENQIRDTPKTWDTFYEKIAFLNLDVRKRVCSEEKRVNS